MDYVTKNNSKIQLSTMSERMGNGHKLYIAAWTFEILAAIIGILIAIVTGLTAYEGFVLTSPNGEVSYEQLSDVILGFVPFVMVALAEILKIPIAYLVYINRNLITKSLFSLILIGLTFITFETVVSGFERQFSNTTSKVRGPADQKNRYVKELATLESSIGKDGQVNETSISKKYTENRVRSRNQSDNEIVDIDKQILDIQANNSGPIGSELKLKKDKLDRLIKQRDDEIDRLISNSSSMKEEFNRDRKIINERLRVKSDRFDKNKDIISRSDAGFCVIGACPIAKKENKSLMIEIRQLESDLKKIRFNQNQEIEKINKKYQSGIDIAQKSVDKLQSKLVKATSSNFQIDSLNSEKVNVRKRLQEKLKKIDIQEKSELQSLDGINKRIKKDTEKVVFLRNEIIRLNEETGKHESFTQIYRFTKYYLNFVQEPICLKYTEPKPNLDTKKGLLFEWFGEEKEELECLNWSETKEITAADVTMEDVSKVAFIWFGSLALLVSIMGIVLAFGAFILKHPNTKFKGREDSKWSITRSIKMVFLASLKKARKPKKVKLVTKEVIKEVPVEKIVTKEVIKEVPVDKVVFKEVPVEVIKKEVVHIPIYTNDPDLLKFGTTKIKDILKDTDNDNKE